MAAVPDVTITAGVPTAGTGTVSTLDKFDGAAGVPATRAITVQGIASGTPQPVSGTVTANAGTGTMAVSLASVPTHAVTNAGTFATQVDGAALTSLQLIDDTVVAQGTALGSTKNSLIGGSVTTAAPTYTTGQISPLNLDTAGNLRVNVAAGGASGGTSSTFGAATPGTGTAVGFSDGTNLQAGRIKAASTPAVAADPAIVVAISPNGQNSNDQKPMSGSAPVVIASDQTKIPIEGDLAHDAIDTNSKPMKIGHVAIAHGTNPTAVAAGDRTHDYANRAGIPFMIGGHPNVITRSATIDDADGAQTDASLLTISAGSKIVVTAISATCASTNSGGVAVRIGFAASTLAAASETGAAGILLEGKFPAGGGNQKGNGGGILGVGADGEDLRITCDDPAGGSLYVTFSYYTIES